LSSEKKKKKTFKFFLFVSTCRNIAAVWKPRHTWEDNIKMDFRERGWEDVYWVEVLQDRVKQPITVNMMMNV
jgi:hypothetical protein